jgi:hypothetical protein
MSELGGETGGNGAEAEEEEGGEIGGLCLAFCALSRAGQDKRQEADTRPDGEEKGDVSCRQQAVGG